MSDRYAAGWICAMLTALPLMAGGAAAQEPPQWAEVAKLFAERCVHCHSGEFAPLELRLDTHGSALAGSANGPVLLAGDAGGSPLIRRLKGEAEPRMPLDGPPYLSDDEIAMVSRWIGAGLPGEPAADEQPAPAPSLPGPGEPTDFRHVAQIFLQRCVKCHTESGLRGGPPEGLRLNSYDAIVRGGERLVVLPGNPGLSEVYRRIMGHAQPRMPFDGPPWLPEDDIRLIRQWIEQGAKNIDGAPAPVPVGAPVRMRGALTGEWEIDGAPFLLERGARVRDLPPIGGMVELRGVVLPDGSVQATRLRGR